ncbi:MAG TPA: carboxypeptidase-like regulatory domain-containing protein [Chryseosolibacter sp.]
MIRRAKPILVCLLLLAPVFSWGQVTVRALVADSATLKPIPYVAVRLNNTYRGTISNEQGYFAMDASENDSLTFSIVGYNPRKVSAQEIIKTSVVYLSQSMSLLPAIEFTGTINISSVLPKLDEESAYRNPTNPRTERPEVLGFQGFQTFGPGYVSRFGELKPSKEEKKLERVKKENEHAKGYVALVNDPEVKDKLMKEYSLTETQYYDHLARFNQKNKDFIYQLDDTEVVRLIFLYFLENVKK